MATIKSFTDLEQSKKLAEILPLESADMYYTVHQSIINPKELEYGDTPKIRDKYISFDNKRIFYPCWSLATLFNIIPQELFGGEYIINITEGLDYKWIISYEYHFEGSSYIDVSGYSLIDCCVDMIIKLKERNLL